MLRLLTGNAGASELGSIENLADLGDFADKHWIYFHLGWNFFLLKDLRKKLAGIERADTVNIDGHKHIGRSLRSGVLLLTDPVPKTASCTSTKQSLLVAVLRSRRQQVTSSTEHTRLLAVSSSRDSGQET